MTTLLKVLARQSGIRIEIYADDEVADPDGLLHPHGVEGITVYDSLRVLVLGTKGLPDLLRVLTHELTHLALDLVFGNRGRPYSEESSSVMEERIASIWLEGKLEGEMDEVFQNYGESEWSAELMAHLMAELVLTGAREETKDLLDLFRDQVQPLCDEVLKSECQCPIP